MKRSAVLLLIIICCLSSAQDKVSPSLERLATAEVFAFGGVGFAGQTSPGERDFKIVLAQSKDIALESFEKLYVSATAQGRRYALAGIRKFNPDRFKELMLSIWDSKEPLRTMSGCIIETRALGAVAVELESGDYDSWIERANKLNRTIVIAFPGKIFSAVLRLPLGGSPDPPASGG